MQSKELFLDALDNITNFYGKDLMNLRIRKINMNYLYTIVELNNEQVGVALNYANAGFKKYRDFYDTLSTSKFFLLESQNDPLLLDTLKKNLGNDIPYLTQSLFCAIFSVLSRPFYFQTKLQNSNYGIMEGSIDLNSIGLPNDTISIIGFGGYLLQALKSQCFSTIFISDLMYSLPEGKKYIDKKFRDFEFSQEKKNVIIHDGVENTDYITKSKVTCITGSALCNDTMWGLLKSAQGCREIVISGHSGLLPPNVYFRLGVTYIGWSSIPRNFMTLIEANDDLGKKFDNFIDETLKPRYYCFRCK